MITKSRIDSQNDKMKMEVLILSQVGMKSNVDLENHNINRSKIHKLTKDFSEKETARFLYKNKKHSGNLSFYFKIMKNSTSTLKKKDQVRWHMIAGIA